jgi:hypothetical protein
LDVLIAMEEGQDNFVEKERLSEVTFDFLMRQSCFFQFARDYSGGEIVKSGKTAEAFALNLPPYKLY